MTDLDEIECRAKAAMKQDGFKPPIAVHPKDVLSLVAAARERDVLRRQVAELRGAVTYARSEIKSLAETGTQRLLDAGVGVDPAERTYGPATQRLTRVLSDTAPAGERANEPEAKS